MKGFFLPPDPTLSFIPSVHIKVLDYNIVVEVLLKTGASVYFMDKDFAKKYNIVLAKKAHPVSVKIIDERPFAPENVIEETEPLEVILENHISHIVFNIIQCPSNPIVLGLPWFELHNPSIDWSSQKISLKVKQKAKKSLRPLFLGAKAFMHATKKNEIFAIYATPMSIFSSNILQEIPYQYKDFKDVFEKKNANILSQHMIV